VPRGVAVPFGGADGVGRGAIDRDILGDGGCSGASAFFGCAMTNLYDRGRPPPRGAMLRRERPVARSIAYFAAVVELSGIRERLEGLREHFLRVDLEVRVQISW